MIAIKAIRLANPQDVTTEDNFHKGEFWGTSEDREEIRLYFFDEDAIPPEGYEEVSFSGIDIPPVAFFRKTEEER